MTVVHRTVVRTGRKRTQRAPGVQRRLFDDVRMIGLDCPLCGGAGMRHSRRCPNCDGSGRALIPFK